MNITDKAPEWEDRLTFGRLALLTTAALAPPVVRLVQRLARRTGRHERAQRRLDRPVPPGGRAHGRLDPPAGALCPARARPASNPAWRSSPPPTERASTPRRSTPPRRWPAWMRPSACATCPTTTRISRWSPPPAAAPTSSASTFPLTILQQWKQERLLDNDAYMVRSYESTLRDPLALPIDDEGSVFVAPLFMREELHGIMVVSTPEEMPRSASPTRCRPCPHRWPWPWRAPRSPRTCCCQAERGTLRLAGAELLGHRDRARARHDDPVREPVGASRARRRT